MAQTLGLTDVPDLVDKYLGLSQRHPDALITYASNLSNNDVKPFFQIFARAVLEGQGTNAKFHAVRREVLPGTHLERVFNGRPHLADQWHEVESASYQELTSQNEGLEEREFDATNYLKARILDFNHLSRDLYPTIYACLEDLDLVPLKLEELKKAQQNIIKEIKEIDPAKRSIITKQLKIFQFEVAMLLVLDKRVAVQEKINILERKILPVLQSLQLDNLPFRNDLEGLRDLMKPTNKNLGINQWVVTDSDDWQDLLLCGTEVVGSCQHIVGNGMNRCLVNYLMDDKIRLVVVKNEQGIILARTILRLLYDPKSQGPVLFKERIYLRGEVSEEQASMAINKLCLRKAKKMNIPLTAKREKGLEYPNPLHSYNAKCSEYVDADRLGETRGIYQISPLELNFLT